MNRICCSVLVASICFAAAGCLPGKEDKPPAGAKEYLYFPPLLENARIQFLCNLTGSRDVEPAPSALERFLLGDEPKQFRTILKPFGVAARDGKVYVCDSMDLSIAVIDMAKRRYETFGKKGPGRLRKPINIRFDKEGLIYVTDTLREQVVVFNPNGSYNTAYGKPGDFLPVDVAVIDDEIYIVDRREHRIEVYDKKTRELKRVLGSLGREPGQFNRPINMTVDTEGNIYVTDQMNNRIQKIDREGKPLLQFGQAGDTPGCFSRPKGVAVDREGHIYVVDAMHHVVQLFDQKGQALMHFGGGGTDDGQLALPAQIALDYDSVDLYKQYISPDFKAKYLIFVTNQVAGNKVSVFAFGKGKGVAATENE